MDFFNKQKEAKNDLHTKTGYTGYILHHFVLLKSHNINEFSD